VSIGLYKFCRVRLQLVTCVHIPKRSTSSSDIVIEMLLYHKTENQFRKVHLYLKVYKTKMVCN